MAIRLRFYVFEETGALKRIPRSIADRLPFGEDAIPEYAGTRQRIAQVVVENEKGKPARILDATGSYWDFDTEGRIDKSLHASMLAVLEASDARPTSKTGKVVDLRPELKRKSFQEKHRWNLTAEDLDRIAADLWPEMAKVNEVRIVKGKVKKAPPLTWEAKQAIDTVHSSIASISVALQNLTEPALKGLVHEANRIAAVYGEDRHVWQAVALEADKHREIQARHRTGRGTFYAVLHVWQKVGKHEMRDVDTQEVNCQGKAAAIETSRRLLAENAHRFSESISIEAEVLTDLEWGLTPNEDGGTILNP